MNLMQGGSSYEIIQSQPFDSRSYFQVNALQPTNNYPRQDQMALQLVYEYPLLPKLSQLIYKFNYLIIALHQMYSSVALIVDRDSDFPP